MKRPAQAARASSPQQTAQLLAGDIKQSSDVVRSQNIPCQKQLSANNFTAMTNSVPLRLHGISSMATRQILAELAEQCPSHLDCQLAVESLGGVEAAKKVRAGERFDLVFLADDVLASLESDGYLLPGSRRPLMRSEVVLAVPISNDKPAINTEAALKAAVCAAESIGYSTGPSGSALLTLFERWGLLAELKPQLVLAPAGVPVGHLITEGRAAIGFQQRSEFLAHPGIAVVGPLPESAAIETIFSGALGCDQSDEARVASAQQVLDFLASAQAAPVLHAYGMSPVTPSFHRDPP